MSVKLSKRNLLLSLYIVGGLLLVVAGSLWWDHRNTDPGRVFWGMVDQSMKSSGVTVQSAQSGNGQNVHQTIQYSTGGQSATHMVTSLTQGGTSITDEMIGTPEADYTRYTGVKTDQLSASGKKIDFSKILGVWAKTDNGAQGSQLLPQSILGTNLPLGGVAVPVAALQPSQRAMLQQEMQKDGVYNVSFSDVQRTHQNGRLVYDYTVHIKPDKYAMMMKLFGKVSGLHALDAVNPEQYAGQPEFTLKMTVDVRAHQLIAASSQDGTVRQTYSGYDMPVIIKAPAHSISSTELQKRLQQIQQ